MAIDYYKGFDTYVIYGVEAANAYGVPVAPTVGNFVGRVTNVTLNMSNNMIKSRGIGEGRNVTNTLLGGFDCSGSIAWEVCDFTFMQYAVGTIAGAGTVANPYELQEANSILSLTLEIGQEGNTATDQTLTAEGVMINSLTISGSEGSVLTASCDFIAENVVRATSLETYTTPTQRTFVFQQGSVQIDTANPAAEGIEISSFSVTLGNNYSTHRALASRFIKKPILGMRTYEFSFTMKKKFDDTASTLSTTELLSYFFEDTNSPATGGIPTAKYISIDIVEGAGSTHRVCSIDLENVYFDSWSEPVNLNEVIEVTVSGHAHAGLTDGAAKIPVRWYAIA